MRQRVIRSDGISEITTMPLTTTEHKYVQIDEHNVPIIAETTMKVVELVEAHIAYGWSPEELHLNHRYLTMSQIYSALAYYWDHKSELDADLEQREQYVKQAEQEAGKSPFAALLRTQGLLK